jgi:23S rRNA (cytidine1920-2'-O)/16S rRNA (cytidine1409-2'-O)-methyltransferase
LVRRRLDTELVRRGLAPSRTAAQRVIEAGLVTVGGAPASHAARMVADAEPVLILAPPSPFVSRGGEKLDAALEHFRLGVDGLHVLDAGASTGGFTDCVLQRGASHVTAVDVGHGQLHPKIRDDARVSVFERCNVRALPAALASTRFELVVADLSFISLRLVLPSLLSVLASSAPLVALVKPQFEAGRREVSRGKGVITDPEVHARVQAEVAASLTTLGATIMGWVTSPIRGTEGNVEFFVHARSAS